MSLDNNYKNIYMFKNSLRHFLNAENLIYPEFVGDNKLDDANDKNNRSRPVSFFIRKNYDKDSIRVIKLPNFLNFYFSYNYFCNIENFYNFNSINTQHSRVKVSLETGDFKSYYFQKNIISDLTKLTEYDLLYRFDIKSFYKSIYVHRVSDIEEFNQNVPEKAITNIDRGKTNGIIMGNYISLFIAEYFLRDITKKLFDTFKEEQIPCVINNFSDDIYIFSDKKYESKIKDSLEKVLFSFDLELNELKIDKFDYERYNQTFNLTKLWKSIVKKQKEYEMISLKREKKDSYHMNFTNLLIYYGSKMDDEKKKMIFYKNFFKSEFFSKLELISYEKRYKITEDNIHHFKHIISKVPETILYIVPKLKKDEYFKASMYEWMRKKFDASLDKYFYEEQLYYFFGLYHLDPIYSTSLFKSDEFFKNVMRTDNQILKSYLVSFFLNEKQNLDELLSGCEDRWFIDYHILLKIHENQNNNIDDKIFKIIPKEHEKGTKDQKSEKEKSYIEFYRNNIENKNLFIKSLEDVEKEIQMYLELKSIEKQNGEDLAKNYL